MRQWLRLFEDIEVYSPEEEDPGERAEQERYDHQRQIEKRVQEFCETQLGWSFDTASYAIIYDMDDHEISIRPDDPEVTLEQLQKLAAMGDVTVNGSAEAWALHIQIKTSPGFNLSR